MTVAKRQAVQKKSVAPLGEPSGRLLELFAKTVVPQPYQVSDQIVVQPLTKTLRSRLGELRNQRMVGNFFLAEALKHQGEQAPTDADLAQLTKIIEDADDTYNRLFFGAAHDDVMAFFADRAPEHWDAFCKDINEQFMPSGATGPATGACEHCGHVLDEEQAGKGSASST